jgi:selenocysteine lyase/cysteine desulfurase
MLTSFRHHLRSLQRPEASTSNPEPKVVAVIDAIVSNPGALLPWEEMVKICREENVWSVVDAAHCIGQQVGINLSQSKPDFWVSVRSAYEEARRRQLSYSQNCHKWLYAKRGCAVLYVAERSVLSNAMNVASQ